MKYFIGFIFLVVIATIVTGLIVVGSPQHARELRWDRERMNDLQYLQNEISYYWQRKGILPASLETLNDTMRGISVSRDPETGVMYEYMVKSDQSFTLCAAFSLPSEEGQGSIPGPLYGTKDPYSSDTWEHGEGRTCFDRTIDEDYYPPLDENGAPIGMPVPVRS